MTFEFKIILTFIALSLFSIYLNNFSNFSLPEYLASLLKKLLIPSADANARCCEREHDQTERLEEDVGVGINPSHEDLSVATGSKKTNKKKIIPAKVEGKKLTKKTVKKKKKAKK